MEPIQCSETSAISTEMLEKKKKEIIFHVDDKFYTLTFYAIPMFMADNVTKYMVVSG
jgi:hypothetical protein